MPRILRLNMYRKLHHNFLQNFPVVDVSQVVIPRKLVKGLLEKEVSQKVSQCHLIPKTP